MSSANDSTTAAAPEERIGQYRVHPVASMFPPLPDDEYEDLKGSIELMGQTYPIIVQDGWLLDGRNRLRACIELELPPKIQEYRGTLTPEFFIETVNMHRRHLDEGARAAISAKIRAWIISRQNAEAQKTGKSADGKAGGRGRKKNLEMNSSLGLLEPLLEPKTRAKDARSTVGQIAEAAQVSHHKAAQAVAVAKAAPDLLDQVATGKVTLKDAAKQARAATPERTPKHSEQQSRRKPDEYLDVKTKLVGRVYDVIKKYPKQRSDLWSAIMVALVGRDHRSVSITGFIEWLQGTITRTRLMTGLSNNRSATLVSTIDRLQYELTFFAKLHAEIVRRCETEATPEEAEEKRLIRTIDWIYKELEKYRREQTAEKPKAK
jgi:hypothetical protein